MTDEKRIIQPEPLADLIRELGLDDDVAQARADLHRMFPDPCERRRFVLRHFVREEAA